MKREDYPPQEPLSEAGQVYGDECWRRSQGIEGEEQSYGDDPYQRLIIHAPPRPDAPTLLFWHGGGWTSGYKEWMSFMAPAFTAAGVRFVTGGYRLAPRHVFPAALDDCSAALAWVSDRFGPNVFIGGHSAGGHYAALIAANGGARRVRGCLAISGVFGFGDGSGLSMRPRFLGSDLGNDRRASPLHHLAAPLPPFLIAHGTKDFPHLIAQAARFVEALRGRDAIVEHLPLVDRTHFTASYAAGEPDGPWVPAALRFIARHAG